MASNFALHGSMIPRTVKRLSDHREEPRADAAPASATLTFRDKPYSVGLINLSPSGAMVAFARVPRIGETVSLQLDGRKAVEARVRWACDGRIGIHFATRLE